MLLNPTTPDIWLLLFAGLLALRFTRRRQRESQRTLERDEPLPPTA